MDPPFRSNWLRRHRDAVVVVLHPAKSCTEDEAAGPAAGGIDRIDPIVSPNGQLYVVLPLTTALSVIVTVTISPITLVEDADCAPTALVRRTADAGRNLIQMR